MFNLVSSLDNKIEENEKKIEELLNQVYALDQKAATLWKELELTPAQMLKFMKDSSNFTEENWQYLSQKKKELDEQLKKHLNAIADPRKTKEKMKQRKAASQPHWLYVK